MKDETKQRIIALLTEGRDISTRADIESRYPKRQLASGAEVMRVPPSPTGFVHIGTIYAGLVNERIAHQSDGMFLLRIEDTDKKREVEGSVNGIKEAFAHFGLDYDGGPDKDDGYGPYYQSQRGDMYLAYALELLHTGWAYPCFATSDELAENAKKQQAAKVRPGYYGQWALWRDKSDEEVVAALDAGRSFVLRFRSRGSHDKRIQFDDVFKGHMEVPENDLDVPLIKSDEWRLPTYHLAHIVDDYLMGTTKVFRSDEWLPSTALHIEMSQALGLQPFNYGHFAPISILDKNGGGKRKLSKRKDPEADVSFWIKAGYPVSGVHAYLLGLANSNFEDWYRANPDKDVLDFQLSLEKLAASRAPLLDMTKLENYTKDVIARLPQGAFNKEVLAWTDLHDKPLFDAMMVDPEYTNKVLAIERDGDNPRKDVAKWSDAPEQFSFFYDDLFKTEMKNDIEQNACAEFLKTYDSYADKETWFENMKQSAESAGFCLDRKELKANPDKYRGGIADFAGIIRVALTGKTRTPDLWTIMQIMGEDRVRSRLS
ncbi:glutamate--tRNA ligase [Candidatus Saccharibacteria bacterium]|nr:glutamate--tRNA ligase [Candidatus Saccharibacteria bacterium]